MLLFLLVSGYCLHTHAAVRLSGGSDVATAGYFQLNWSEVDRVVRLDESMHDDFADYRTVYEGRDSATVISGQSNGEYYYRIVDDAGSPSNIFKVTVEHHSLGKAWGFFMVGAVVFLATLLLVVRGRQLSA